MSVEVMETAGGETNVLDGVEYVVLGEIGYYDYEWHIGKALRRRSDGRLFFAADSGCSCFGWGDGPPTLTAAANRAELVEAAKAEFSDADEAIVRFAERLLF